MNSRRAPRTRKRMACALIAEQRRYAGMILDLSAVGLFVQTGAKLSPGDLLSLEFDAPGLADPIRLEARVARRKAVPARLQSVVQRGVGVELVQAPETYFAFVATLQQAELETASPAPSGAKKAEPKQTKPKRSASKKATSRSASSKPSTTKKTPPSKTPPGKTTPKKSARRKAPFANQRLLALMRRSAPEPAPKPAAPPVKPVCFRVSVSQTQGTRTRTVNVEAPDEHEACKRALAEFGDDWKVLSCEPI